MKRRPGTTIPVTISLGIDDQARVDYARRGTRETRSGWIRRVLAEVLDKILIPGEHVLTADADGWLSELPATEPAPALVLHSVAEARARGEAAAFVGATWVEGNEVHVIVDDPADKARAASLLAQSVLAVRAAERALYADLDP